MTCKKSSHSPWNELKMLETKRGYQRHSFAEKSRNHSMKDFFRCMWCLFSSSSFNLVMNACSCLYLNSQSMNSSLSSQKEKKNKRKKEAPRRTRQSKKPGQRKEIVMMINAPRMKQYKASCIDSNTTNRRGETEEGKRMSLRWKGWWW